MRDCFYMATHHSSKFLFQNRVTLSSFQNIYVLSVFSEVKHMFFLCFIPNIKNNSFDLDINTYVIKINYLTLWPKVKFKVTSFLYMTLGHVQIDTHTKYESCNMKNKLYQRSRSQWPHSYSQSIGFLLKGNCFRTTKTQVSLQQGFRSYGLLVIEKIFIFSYHSHSESIISHVHIPVPVLKVKSKWDKENVLSICIIKWSYQLVL